MNGCGELVKVEKEIGEIRRMGRLKKRNERWAKSRKVEKWIRNVGRGRGRRMTGSGNLEADGENLRSRDVARGMPAEGAGR
jgi:hypothetical protein